MAPYHERTKCVNLNKERTRCM